MLFQFKFFLKQSSIINHITKHAIHAKTYINRVYGISKNKSKISKD